MHLEQSHSPAGLPTMGAVPRPSVSPRIFPQFEEEFCTREYLGKVLEQEFRFNGETHRLDDPIDWLKNPSRDIEWHILLHKFYFAVGLAREYERSRDARHRDCFTNLVTSWIDQVEPGFIATDVTGRRVQNWIYAWYLFRQDGHSPFDSAFERKFTDSLVEQVDYILENMAPARNHRTLEIYAVFLAAIAFPTLKESPEWLERATEAMISNIRTDLLPDGVHCELASDYHHIVLRSYLLFYRLAANNGLSLPHDIPAALCRALEYSLWLHRPDGLIPALSDSDSRSYLYLLAWGAELFDRADFAFVGSRGRRGHPPDETNRIFESGGYAVMRSAWEAGRYFRDARHLVFDCGPIGAGNHGHLDALNVEISAHGHPLIVDPGRFSYDEQAPNWRARFRRTAAHNTVTVDGMDQAIYRQRGSKMKIGQPHPVTSLIEADVEAHIPYLHGRIESPNYEAVHDRRIWFPRGQYWIVLDSLTAAEDHDYDLRFQLTPAAEGTAEIVDRRVATEILSPGLQMLFVAPRERVSIETGYTSTEYGIKHAAPVACVRRHAGNCHFLTVIAPFRREAGRLSLERNETATVIRISSEVHEDSWAWHADDKTISMSLPGWKQTWSCKEPNIASA